jgi:hypothetical protein
MSKIADLVAAIVVIAAALGLVISVGILAVAAIGALLTRQPPTATTPRRRL